MPSRVIKGEINASDSLSRVSIEADLTFRALLVACDDYGRFDGRLGVLKATLFPLRDEMTAERIDRAIDELVRAGCVTRYASDGRPYLAMPNWEKHRAKGRRGNASRYPDPASTSSDLGSACASEELHDRVGGRGSYAGDEGRGTRDVGSDVDAPPDVPRPGHDLALEFAELIRAGPVKHAKVPDDLSRWALAMDRLERIDKVPREDIRAVMRWATADGFWASNVLSGDKLREQFAVLHAQMQRASPRASPRGGFDRPPSVSEIKAALERQERRA